MLKGERDMESTTLTAVSSNTALINSEPDFIAVREKAMQLVREDHALRRPRIRLTDDMITVPLCRKLYLTIKNFIPLKEFQAANGLSKMQYMLLLQFVLPLIEGDIDLDVYFLTVLGEMYNDENNWVHPSVKRTFQIITGLVYPEKSTYGRRQFESRILYLSRRYHHVYFDLFERKRMYPQGIIREAREHFVNMEPMGNVCRRLYDAYSPMGAPFIVFFGECVYACFGYEKMFQYLTTLSEIYVKSLPYYLEGTVKFTDITKYIFQYQFSATTFTLGTYTRNSENATEFTKCLYRALFPFTYENYRTTRQKVYKYLDLSEDEKNEYNLKYFSTPMKKNIAVMVNIHDHLNEETFKHGTTFHEMQEFIDHYFDEVVYPTRTLPNKADIKRELNKRLDTMPGSFGLDFRRAVAYGGANSMVITAIDKNLTRMKAGWCEENDKAFGRRENVIRLYIHYKGAYIFRILDFNEVHADDFRREIRMFAGSMHYAKLADFSYFSPLVKALNYFCDEYEITRAKDIRDWHILTFLHTMQNEGIQAATITHYLYIIRHFISFLMNDSDYAERPEIDVTLAMRFMGQNDRIKNTHPIPEDIQAFMDEHIDELPEVPRLMFRIQSQVLWRFDDVANIRTDCFSEFDKGLLPEDMRDDDVVRITTKIQKTGKSRRKHRMGEYITDVISRDLYNEVMTYIRKTDPIRKAYHTDYVFFNIYAGEVHEYRSNVINIPMQKLMKQYGIESIDTTYEGFTTRQSRKTGATALIESGETLESVQHKLGHVNSATTARYYAEVRAKKRGELDSEFFRQQFNLNFDENVLKNFSDTERKALYYDFCNRIREVEYGECTKKACEGSCFDVGDGDCAVCPKLVTGPQYLDRWQALLNDSKDMLGHYRTAYEKAGIPEEEYGKFLEYRKEMRRCSHYQAVVDALLRWEEDHEKTSV